MHYEAQWIQFFFHKGYELYDAFESLRSNLCPLEQKPTCSRLPLKNTEFCEMLSSGTL